MRDLNERELKQKEMQELRLRDPFANETLLELDRILASGAFQRVQQTARSFLTFVVTEKLLGRSNQIKELTIGISVYREPDFNPVQDRKVSVAAAALRERLALYYATEGKDDPIAITIPKGTYVPVLRDRRISIEVSDFMNLNLRGGEEYLCHAVPAEIVLRLCEIPWIQANRTKAPTVGARQLSYSLKGCLESSDGAVRLHIFLASLKPRKTICWRCFEAPRNQAIKLAQKVGDIIIDVLRPTAEHDQPRSVA